MDTSNVQGVVLAGEDIAVLMPRRRMTPHEAMMFAAWLVCMAQIADFKLPRFEVYLSAVRST